MEPGEALARFSRARVAHMATVRPDGAPHIVPVAFCLLEGVVVTVVDEKPKTTRALQRLRNVEADPRVSFLADHYAEDWATLWWVRVDGRAVVAERPEAEWLEALAGKYPQYLEVAPAGPAIAATIERVTGWSAAPPG